MLSDFVLCKSNLTDEGKQNKKNQQLGITSFFTCHFRFPVFFVYISHIRPLKFFGDNFSINFEIMKDLKYKQQESEYLTMSRLLLTIIFFLVTIVLLVIGFFSETDFADIGKTLIGVWVLYFFLFWYQKAAYNRYSYAMDHQGLYINHGVLWRKKIVIPRNRVQHTDIAQGPLDRQFDLAELVIHTAGTRNASVKLVGVFREDAEDLRESLSFDESNDAV